MNDDDASVPFRAYAFVLIGMAAIVLVGKVDLRFGLVFAALWGGVAVWTIHSDLALVVAAGTASLEAQALAHAEQVLNLNTALGAATGAAAAANARADLITSQAVSVVGAVTSCPSCGLPIWPIPGD